MVWRRVFLSRPDSALEQLFENESRRMSRFRAAFIHLLLSLIPISVVIGMVFLIWYPEPSLEVLGAASIMQLVVVVHLAIGPLLTLVVYKHGKPGLRFDLIVIVLLQIAALAYGSYRLYDEKPHYLVFTIDRLEYVPLKQIDSSAIRYDELRSKSFAELILVFARPPEDPEEYQRYLNSVAFEGQPDLERRAEYWEPWMAGADVIRHKIKSLEDIGTETTAEQNALQQAIDNYASAHPELGVIPIGGVEDDIGMLLDRRTLELLSVLRANPWKSSEE
jgi:hypothetical protein